MARQVSHTAIIMAAKRNSALVTEPNAKQATTSIISTVAEITLVFKLLTFFREMCKINT